MHSSPQLLQAGQTLLPVMHCVQHNAFYVSSYYHHHHHHHYDYCYVPQTLPNLQQCHSRSIPQDVVHFHSLQFSL